MDIKQALAKVVARQDLTEQEMQAVMRQIMTGNASDSQIGGFLIALRMKGETVTEITGAAKVMRELATPVQTGLPHIVDIVGTGGDGANLFNVSSACAFVTAAAGVSVAKHGNRSVSSSSGSADLLEAVGININLTPTQIAACVQQVGIGFMFAPQHHSAMKYAIGPRKEMALRTIFNILGPLTNPAQASHYLVGVFEQSLCLPIAKVLAALGAVHALVVHAEVGLDELSLEGITHVAEYNHGKLTSYIINAEDVGLQQQSLEGLQVIDSTTSKKIIDAAFAGQHAKAIDMIAFNAGVAIYVADKADSLQAGVAIAKNIITSGAAAKKMAELAEFSQQFKG